MVKRAAGFDATLIRDLSEAVYRDRLGRSDAASAIAKSGEAVLRKRASVYDPITRSYLKALKHFGLLRED
jgi:hypothetical protein